MRDSNEMNGSGFLTGFLMGTTVGAVTTLLLAPKSGREVRRELGESGERLRDRARDAAADIESRGTRAVDRTRQAARDAVDGVKEAARIAKEG